MKINELSETAAAEMTSAGSIASSMGGGNGFVNKDNAWHNFDVLDDKEIRKTVCITKRIKVKEQPPQWVLDKIAATTGVIK